MRERGDLGALTFLWEIVGLFPRPNGDGSSSARAGDELPTAAKPDVLGMPAALHGQYLDDPDEGCSLPDVESEGSQVK